MAAIFWVAGVLFSRLACARCGAPIGIEGRVSNDGHKLGFCPQCWEVR